MSSRWVNILTNAKRVISKILIISLILCINNFAAVVTDSDGSAFITKAEFDSLKNNFQTQIDSYNQAIDSKIDGAIAAYLAGVRIQNEVLYQNRYAALKLSGTPAADGALRWSGRNDYRYNDAAIGTVSQLIYVGRNGNVWYSVKNIAGRTANQRFLEKGIWGQSDAWTGNQWGDQSKWDIDNGQGVYMPIALSGFSKIDIDQGFEQREFIGNGGTVQNLGEIKYTMAGTGESNWVKLHNFSTAGLTATMQMSASRWNRILAGFTSRANSTGILTGDATAGINYTMYTFLSYSEQTKDLVTNNYALAPLSDAKTYVIDKNDDTLSWREMGPGDNPLEANWWYIKDHVQTSDIIIPTDNVAKIKESLPRNLNKVFLPSGTYATNWNLQAAFFSDFDLRDYMKTDDRGGTTKNLNITFLKEKTVKDLIYNDLQTDGEAIPIKNGVNIGRPAVEGKLTITAQVSCPGWLIAYVSPNSSVTWDGIRSSENDTSWMTTTSKYYSGPDGNIRLDNIQIEEDDNIYVLFIPQNNGTGIIDNIVTKIIPTN